MYMQENQFSPDVKLGFVSASRNCFPRELSEKRMARIAENLKVANVNFVVPPPEASVIESKEDAVAAANFFKANDCDAAILYLGNFSPEIEDAIFVKNFDKPILLMAAAEEDAESVASARGDALCGLMSASLAISKRGMLERVMIPANPLVDAKQAVVEIEKFVKVCKVVKGIKNATIGLFGPRPRDFESCNYNIASLASIGVEVEEFGLFDLEETIANLRANKTDFSATKADMQKIEGVEDETLAERLSLYENALLQWKKDKKLSAASTQCWTRQESFSKHVPCFVNARLTESGFPVACENDAYSLCAELMCQYASNAPVTMLDINHTIPADMLKGVEGVKVEDVMGLFHCGNVPAKYLKSPKVCHQLIMSRLMEPNQKPDITRGTLEGEIKPNKITILQIHGSGDGLRAYICEGEFLDVDACTFGSVGVAHVPGFMRFYRNCLLGRFHHHAAVAFTHCASELYEALKLLGVKEIYTPSDALYPNENPFEKR